MSLANACPATTAALDAQAVAQGTALPAKEDTSMCPACAKVRALTEQFRLETTTAGVTVTVMDASCFQLDVWLVKTLQNIFTITNVSTLAHPTLIM